MAAVAGSRGNPSILYKLLELSNEVLGWPYQKGGRDRTGIDCFGLFKYVQNELGRPVPDFDYVEETTRTVFAANFAEYLNEIKQEDLKPGDVVTFYTRLGSAEMVHIGTAMSQFRVLHTDREVGPVISRLDRGPLSRTKVRFFEFRLDWLRSVEQ